MKNWRYKWQLNLEHEHENEKYNKMHKKENEIKLFYFSYNHCKTLSTKWHEIK